LHSGVDASVYSALLFEQSTGIQINDLTNNFSKSLLKRRFVMMNKKRTTKVARLKLLVALPLALSLLLVISFSPEVMAQEKKTIPPPPPKTTKTDAKPVEKVEPVKIEKEELVYTVVEEMPQYPGGQKAMYAYLGENIKYPEEAKKKGISGTVFVTFVILDNGEVSNVSILRGVGYGCDEEALRVVKGMPKWTPGKQDGKPVNVSFNLPIKFNLAEDKKEEKKPEK
ncbi:MAG TPA: energy transducer TonB, partial [Bacteroidales bacterium]|nr:energy transducer TonB [Bacteroidales bacterium]